MNPSIYNHLTIVPVIASFDTNGNIKPIYVRINNESLKIISAINYSESTFNVVEYSCKVIDGDYIKPLSLTYHAQDRIWTISKN